MSLQQGQITNMMWYKLHQSRRTVTGGNLNACIQMMHKMDATFSGPPRPLKVSEEPKGWRDIEAHIPSWLYVQSHLGL